jgi:hypothetical protein
MGQRMVKRYEPLDCNGKPIFAGDSVVLVRASEKLIAGLPDEDQKAIQAQVGNVLKVNEFDEYGHAEIEFVDTEGMMHTIWIEPSCLRKQE